MRTAGAFQAAALTLLLAGCAGPWGHGPHHGGGPAGMPGAPGPACPAGPGDEAPAPCPVPGSGPHGPGGPYGRAAPPDAIPRPAAPPRAEDRCDTRCTTLTVGPDGRLRWSAYARLGDPD